MEIISVKATALPIVKEAGFKITALPHIIAGAAFHAGIAIGKFQGDIIPTTPRGSLDIST